MHIEENITFAIIDDGRRMLRRTTRRIVNDPVEPLDDALVFSREVVSQNYAGAQEIVFAGLILSSDADEGEEPEFICGDSCEIDFPFRESQVSQLNSTLQRLVENKARKHYEHLEAACKHMNPDLLTEDQRFAVARQAGAGTTIRMDADGKHRWIPEPCKIDVVDGKWVVSVLDK